MRPPLMVLVCDSGHDSGDHRSFRIPFIQGPPMVEKGEITGWLDALGITYQDAEITDPEESFAWALGVSGKPYHCLVAQRDIELNHLVIQVSIRVSDNHRELLSTLPPDDRDRFIHDLRIHLLRTPVGYELEFDEGDPAVLTRMSFGYNVFDDPLKRGGFFRRHHQVQSAALLGVQLLRKLARFKKWD